MYLSFHSALEHSSIKRTLLHTTYTKTCIITTKRTRWSHKTYYCTHKTHSMVSHCTFHNTFHKTCIAHPHKTYIAPSTTPFHKTYIAHITKRKLCLSQNVQLHLPQNVHCTFHNTFHKTYIAHLTKRTLRLSQNVQLHLPQNVHCTFHNTFHKTYIAHLTKRTLCLSQNVMAQHMPDVGRVWRCQRPMGLPRQPGCFVMGSSMRCHGANPGFMVEVGFGFCFLSVDECPHPARYVFFVAGRT